MRIYRATVSCTHSDGTLVMPSLHYKTDPPPLGDEPAPDDVASAIWGLIGDQLRACTTSDVTFHELVVTEEVVPPDLGVAGSFGGLGAGTGVFSDEALPHGLVPVLNLHTATRSRSARGWFRPASPGKASVVNGNVWTSAYMTILNNLAAVLDDDADMGSLTTTHLQPVVYSRTRHLRSEDPYWFDVTSGSANPRCHWLRTRMTNP